MTKLRILTGYVYTNLSPGEVRTYLQGGSKTGTIDGFEDEAGTIPIIIAVHAIEYIYK
ncbi:hypothetical protein D3C74_55140 [compost metagenome]